MATLSADVEAVFSANPTISGRIRGLAKAGYSRSDIAKLMGRSYQQVRNVLVNDAQLEAQRGGASKVPAIQQGMAEGQHVYGPPLVRSGEILVWVDVAPNGALQLPEPARAALETAQGGKVLVQVTGNGSVALLSARTAMLQAQAMMHPFIKPGASVVDELLTERRTEAARENDGG
jgi:hypothetical protein